MNSPLSPNFGSGYKTSQAPHGRHPTVDPIIHITQEKGPHIGTNNQNPNVATFGVFQKYLVGIFNPAFKGMFLLDYSTLPNLSEYKICKFHTIKSGIIVYGNEAFVFTPISNNDMQSYLKIMLRDRPLPYNMTKTLATRLIVEYIRANCRKAILPCLHLIKNYLSDIVGLSEETFVGDENSFFTLLHRVYLFMFMLHYGMPLQRKNTPGKRNVASSVHCRNRKGWYSYLSAKEQKILDQTTIFVSSNSIPDDLINGIPIKQLIISQDIKLEDKTNSCIIRDRSIDNVTFQQTIKSHAHELATKNGTKKKNYWEVKGRWVRFRRSQILPL